MDRKHAGLKDDALYIEKLTTTYLVFQMFFVLWTLGTVAGGAFTNHPQRKRAVVRDHAGFNAERGRGTYVKIKCKIK